MLSYVLINCHPGSEPDVISEIKSIPEVQEVNGIMGKYDIFVKISSDTPDGLDLAVSKLRRIKFVTYEYVDYCSSILPPCPKIAGNV
jgi:DNA-binding Lrp family transcriptional regulator